MDELNTVKSDSSAYLSTTGQLPKFAYTSLNRCNVPASILGCYDYQQKPIKLSLDCVAELHAQFFESIETIADAEIRSHHFRQYMCSAFLLGKSDEAGVTETNQKRSREKLDYLRLLRGWMFDADSIEAAVLKRWVESRFGLLTINHSGLLNSATPPPSEQSPEQGAEQPQKNNQEKFQHDFSQGLYNTNALDSQLDLLYSYCQYELQRQHGDKSHWQLFRGVSNLAKHTQLSEKKHNQQLLLLNNLNSFSGSDLLAQSFGDLTLTVQVPYSKLLFYPQLLPGVLKGENEYLVIGGVYQAKISAF